MQNLEFEIQFALYFRNLEMMGKEYRVSIYIMLILIVAAIIVNYFYTKSDYEKSTRMYDGFGIRLPKGYRTHGIDISRYQQGINWPLVKEMKDNGISFDFAIMKCTEGTWLLDRTFKSNWKETKEIGMQRGAYLFFHPNKNAEAQANFFIKNAKLEEGDFVPVVDIEVTNGLGKVAIQTALKKCLDVLEKKYNAKPMIYCNADYYNNYLGETFDEYPLWVAHYKVASPGVDRDWDLWQHNDQGNVNGIDGTVDFNVASNDLFQIKKLQLD